jgi:hypothetical protein
MKDCSSCWQSRTVLKTQIEKEFPCSTFELNDQPLSALKHGAIAFPAFSGLGSNVNRRISACLAGKGPIPPGEYYLLDRQTGGRLGSLYNALVIMKTGLLYTQTMEPSMTRLTAIKSNVATFVCIQKVRWASAKDVLLSTQWKIFSACERYLKTQSRFRYLAQNCPHTAR